MASRSIGEPGAASLEPVGSRLDANLAALGGRDAALARLIAETTPRTDVEFVLADDGLLSGSMVDNWGRRTQLASRRRPSEEAERLAARVEIDKAAVIVVNGFAMGHHVRAILARAKSSALVVVYEPDVALLRAVLERQDHAEWLRDPLLRFVTDASDGTALGGALEGSEGLLDEVSAALGALSALAEFGDRQLADTAMDNLAEDIGQLEQDGLDVKAEADAALEIARLLEQFPTPG